MLEGGGLRRHPKLCTGVWVYKAKCAETLRESSPESLSLSERSEER